MYVKSRTINEYVRRIQYINRNIPVISVHSFGRSYPLCIRPNKECLLLKATLV